MSVEPSPETSPKVSPVPSPLLEPEQINIEESNDAENGRCTFDQKIAKFDGVDYDIFNDCFALVFCEEKSLLC